jgi:hypothetical protein
MSWVNLGVMSTGETGIRSVAATVIAEIQGAMILRRKGDGYEFTGVFERTSVECPTWPEAERVLIRLGVSPEKINKILRILASGDDVILRREVIEESSPVPSKTL